MTFWEGILVWVVVALVLFIIGPCIVLGVQYLKRWLRDYDENPPL